jgi:hypothetical protein
MEGDFDNTKLTGYLATLGWKRTTPEEAKDLALVRSVWFPSSDWKASLSTITKQCENQGIELVYWTIEESEDTICLKFLSTGDIAEFIY